MTLQDTQIADSNTIAIDTLEQIVADTMEPNCVSLTECAFEPEDKTALNNQPNGWVQLLLPLFITLLVVFVDKWVTRWYSSKDEKESRKQFCETILDWIVKIEPIERKFSQSVSELADNINRSDDMQPVAYAMPLTLHDKMKDMSVEKMTEAFLKDSKDDKNKRYANMYNIISNFEFLSKISDSVRESYDSYNKQSFALCQQWNSLFEKFREKCNQLNDNSPYAAALTVWFAQLMSMPNSVNTHIKALEALSVIAFKEDDFEMLNMVSKMHDIAKQSQATSKGYAQVFSNIASNIEITLNSLSESEQFFREAAKESLHNA